MSGLRAAREAAKLTLAEAAKRLGVSVAILRGLEDECYLPSPSEAQALRSLYGAHLTQPEQGNLFR